MILVQRDFLVSKFLRSFDWFLSVIESELFWVLSLSILEV